MDSKFEILKYLEEEEEEEEEEKRKNLNKDLESQENIEEIEYECTICLEKIEEYDFTDKFPCTHNKKMHEKCAKQLSKCPLCRTLTHNSNEIIVNTAYDNTFVVFTIMLCCGGIILLIITLSYSMYMSIGNGTYNNFNSTNTTVNSTNV